jgi:hypothetical protein
MSMSGVLVAAAGLAWDAILHARDPLLAQHEGPFSASNPAHVLIAGGILLALIGQAGTIAMKLSGAKRRVGAVGAALLSLGLMAVIAFSGKNATAVRVGGDKHDHGGQATLAETAAAQQLIARTRAGIRAYQDPALAIKAGYEPVTPLNWPIVEWVNPGFTAAGRVLDTEHPERLMYITGPSGPILAGAMFLMRSPDEAGPDIAGPLTHWHQHSDLCYLPNGTIVGTDGYGFPCPAGATVRPTPGMLHVWIVANPQGPFADDLTPAAIASVLANG